MSWQQYVDQNLMCPVNADGATLECAALVGLDGGLWAYSPDFPASLVTKEQVDAILAGIESNMFPTGSFMIGDKKFMAVQGDVNVARGKIKDGGCCVKKTAQVLVIGVWKTPVNASDCNKLVETLGTYLEGVGY